MYKALLLVVVVTLLVSCDITTISDGDDNGLQEGEDTPSTGEPAPDPGSDGSEDSDDASTVPGPDSGSQEPDGALPIVYSGPIEITAGGVYSGAFESLERSVPAIRIKTSDPVVIENTHIRSLGNHIHSDYGFDAHVTVRNVSAIGIAPYDEGEYTGRFINLDTYRFVLVEHSYLENTSGIYLHLSTQGATVRITENQVRNIDGRRSDGAGSTEGFHLVQFVQIDKGRGLVDSQIAWNEVINDPYHSRVEDVINLWDTTGTPQSPIRVHNNYIEGAYPNHPSVEEEYSGGGIILGDGGGGYQHAFDNQVVATTNYGIAIAGGEHNLIENNRVVACGVLEDGRPIPAQNTGIYIWNQYERPFGNNVGRGNEVAWARGASRNDWWVPDAHSWSDNEAILEAPIPCSAHGDEYGRWLEKLADNERTVGTR
ncbi:MAG: hypothetical protein ACMXYM_04280 [Candidatus Woesearchaeota archaeon]